MSTERSDSNPQKGNIDNIFIDENYVRIQQQRLLETYVRVCGFSGLNDQNYIPYKTIQNEDTQDKVIKLLPALRTVFQTYNIRSITNKRHDKRLVLNLLRQLLKHMNYTLDSKTYHLINQGRITSSSKYRIIPIARSAPEFVEQSSPEQFQDDQE